MSASHEESPKMRLRMDNPFAEGYKELSEDERAMQKLILESYQKEGKVYMKEVQRVRETNPKMSLGEAVRKLYEEIEEEQGKKE